MTVVLSVFSSSATAEHENYDQKMIIVNDGESHLMKGDPYIHSHNKPMNYRKDSVLPFFLKMGWRIQSVHVNAKSKENNLYGYVIIERVRQ